MCMPSSHASWLEVLHIGAISARDHALPKSVAHAAGLAIRDFWGVDADTVVFVADPGLGNILNFNVGGNVDLMVPSVSTGIQSIHLCCACFALSKPRQPSPVYCVPCMKCNCLIIVDDHGLFSRKLGMPWCIEVDWDTCVHR